MLNPHPQKMSDKSQSKFLCENVLTMDSDSSKSSLVVGPF